MPWTSLLICFLCSLNAQSTSVPRLTPIGPWNPTLVPCSWVSEGRSMRACYMPPQSCPNGPFTSVESCAGSQSTTGCVGTSQMRGRWSDAHTGLRPVLVPCGIQGQTYSIMACQCFGNLFGYCAGPCTPTGGVIAVDIPCPGGILTATSCQDEG